LRPPLRARLVPGIVRRLVAGLVGGLVRGLVRRLVRRLVGLLVRRVPARLPAGVVVVGVVVVVVRVVAVAAPRLALGFDASRFGELLLRLTLEGALHERRPCFSGVAAAAEVIHPADAVERLGAVAAEVGDRRG